MRLGDVAPIGITDYAQGELGDIVFIEVDTVDESVAADECLGPLKPSKRSATCLLQWLVK